MPENAIEVDKLRKVFGDFVAVNDVSFQVHPGEIFGFLGSNGAGKSTTIRMLCALLSSTGGSARVAGYDINREPEMVKKHIGYMSQKFSLYEDLTIKENIRFFGGIYGLSHRQTSNRLDWALENAELKGKENTLVRDLPGGWKQRLSLASALLHAPKIVFLDEPTGGVDPLSRRHFWEWIHQLSSEGVTVFVTTHFLDEAEYCHRIMLIHNGLLIAGGSPQELKEKTISTPMYEVDCTPLSSALEILSYSNLVEEASPFGRILHVTLKEETITQEALAVLLREKGIEVKRIERILPTLEDVFIHLVK